MHWIAAFLRFIAHYFIWYDARSFVHKDLSPLSIAFLPLKQSWESFVNVAHLWNFRFNFIKQFAHNLHYGPFDELSDHWLVREFPSNNLNFYLSLVFTRYNEKIGWNHWVGYQKTARIIDTGSVRLTGIWTTVLFQTKMYLLYMA